MNIIVNGLNLEEAEQFDYVGGIITNYGKCTKESNITIAKIALSKEKSGRLW